MSSFTTIKRQDLIVRIIQIKQFLQMEPMEDENCTQQFEEVYRLNRSADDMIFDQIISQLQEVLISPDFEAALSAFMKNNWDGTRKESEVFNEYCVQMKNFIQNGIRRKVCDFSWPRFNTLLKTRKEIIDEQILDTLLSLEDLEHFRAFIRDYRCSFEEQEMHRVLSVKSNKISEVKKVKGKNNIFAQGENHEDIFGKGPLKAQGVKRKSAQEKTQDELLVPDLILTVKPLRKK